MWAEVDGERKKVAWYVMSSLSPSLLPLPFYFFGDLANNNVHCYKRHPYPPTFLKFHTHTYLCNIDKMIVALASEDIARPNVTTGTVYWSKSVSLEDH
jgi:hypothetical protein